MPYNSTLRHAVSVGQTITSTEDNYKAHVNLQENDCTLLVLVLVSENQIVATFPKKQKHHESQFTDTNKEKKIT